MARGQTKKLGKTNIQGTMLTWDPPVLKGKSSSKVPFWALLRVTFRNKKTGEHPSWSVNMVNISKNSIGVEHVCLL